MSYPHKVLDNLYQIVYNYSKSIILKKEEENGKSNERNGRKSRSKRG